MCDSFYYYQKVSFLVHKEQNAVILFIFKNIVPFTLPISFALLFLFNNYIFIFIPYVIPFIFVIYDYYNKSIDSGEMIFFKDKIQIKSEKINIESPFSKFEDIDIVINEYEGQKRSMFSTSLGFNNRIRFTYELKEYEFEIILSKKNIEFLYENLEEWNKQFGNSIEIKNKTFWRFFRFGVKYYS